MMFSFCKQQKVMIRHPSTCESVDGQPNWLRSSYIKYSPFVYDIHKSEVKLYDLDEMSGLWVSKSYFNIFFRTNIIRIQ